MPSIVTHHLFAKDCLKGYEKKVNKDVYYIFAQSFDNLTYYHFFLGFKNKVKRLGSEGQRTKTNEYFLNILDYMKEHELKDNPDVLGYLLGSICHYALDSTCHPFVIYQAGITTTNKKYRGGHEKIEVMIDAIMYEKKVGKPLYQANLSDTLLPKITFKKNLETTISEVFLQTYKVDKMGKKYLKAVKTGNFILKYFVTDKTGFKKKIYKIKDHFGKGKMYQYLSFNITKIDKSYLNLEHEKWCYPTDNTIVKDSSFYDLYDEAVAFAKKLFKVSMDYLHDKINKDKVNKEFKDLSYVSGLDWHLKTKAKYFKY